MAEGIAITFGGWLKQRRKELGVLQEQLAEKIGCSLTTLEKIESGKRRPSGQIAELLADFLHIPADERAAFVAFARTGQTVTSAAATRNPWRSAQVHRTNLPSVLTDLIGRERDGAQARDLLLQPKVRLLTFTGPPGIGKTRLALQVASDLAEYFDDGVYLVELAPVSDPDYVLATAARTLGLNEEQGHTIEAVLFDHVRERRMLLVFDNFEHLLDAAHGVVKLLEASPWLKVLATSREALHVRGERRYSVQTLAQPDLKNMPGLAELATYPSVELFVERAQAVASDFALSEDNSYDVAAVCVGLEGLPLAIELAAARADSLQPREMRGAFQNEGRESRLKLLTQGARDLPARQRTLRSAIEWSYNLLNADEQRLFKRLGIFVGGFTLESAEAVCHAQDAGKAGGADFPSLMSSLADKSLIRAERHDETQRYMMLETIREYASERLWESGEDETLGRAHALHFMRLAERAKLDLMTANDPGLMNRLGKDYDNVRSALHWLRDLMHNGSRRGDRQEHNDQQAPPAEAGTICLRLAGAIWPYWYLQGYINEGRAELAAVLAAAEALPLRLQMAETLNGAGALAYEQGDNASARAFYEASLAIKRETGDASGIASTLNNLGILAHEEGDHASARRLYEEGLAISREIGDRVGVAVRLNNLAELVYDQGDYRYARALNEESLAIKRELGDKMGIASSLGNLGVLAHTQGEYAVARQLYEESLAIRQQVGDNRGIASSLHSLGLVAYAQGDYAVAFSYHRQSLAMRWEMGGKLLVLDSLLALGRLAAAVQEAERGARLLGCVNALWKAMGLAPTADMRTMYEQGLATVQAQLGDAALKKAQDEGSAMSMEEAISYVLKTVA